MLFRSGTPRYILDNASNMLWRWERKDPYGNNVAQGNIEFNLRFAGQYYDTESGLNYNINRMYDADAKRYMQSDPMGLMAGWNTYNYVGRNPLNAVDPLGLAELSVLLIKDYNNLTVNHVALLNDGVVHDIYPILTGEFLSTLSNEISSNKNSIRNLSYIDFLQQYSGEKNINLKKYDINITEKENQKIKNTIKELNNND